MTIDPIHLGSAPNAGTGQNLRSGGQTINDNFAELDTRTATAQATAEQGMAQAVAAKAKADAAIPASALGTTVAQLINGTVPASQLPSFVDDVLEFATLAVFPAVGEAGKIYVATDTNSLYRWADGGRQYLLFSAAKGINSDITELAGLTTALSVPQGGTGGRDQAGARAGLGLGTAATANITTSVTDATAGRVMKVGDFGVGANAAPVPPASDLNANFGIGVFGWGPAFSGAPTNSASGQLINMRGASTRASQIATSHDTDEVFFRRYADNWLSWRKFLLAGDFGIGSTSVPTLVDLNVFNGSGKYRFGSSAANTPAAIFGTVEIIMYDQTNWTQLVVGTSSPEVLFTRSCINGAIQPWLRQYTETIANANGVATRLSNGTMICQFVVEKILDVSTVYGNSKFGYSNWVYPASFIYPPSTSATARNANQLLLSSAVDIPGTDTSGSCGFMHIDVNGAAWKLNTRVSYLAVGRWK